MMTPEQVQAEMQPVLDALKGYQPSQGAVCGLATVLYFQASNLPPAAAWAPCDGAKLKNKDSKLNGVKMPKLEDSTDDAGTRLVPMMAVVEVTPPQLKDPKTSK